MRDIVCFPPRTGIGRSTEYLVRQLRQYPRIDSVSILLSVFPFGKHWTSDSRAIQDLDSGLSVYRLPLPYGWAMRSWRKTDRPRVDRWIPEIDLIHGPAHVLPSRQAAAGVLTVHDTSLIDHPEWYPTPARSFGAQIMDGMEKADRVIVPSEWVRQQLIQINSRWETKIRVVPHDLTFPSQVLALEEKPEKRSQILGLRDPYIFWTGEINPRKNIPLLFATLAALRRVGYPHLRLVLAGSRGYQSDFILEQAGRQGLSIDLFPPLGQESAADVILYGFVSEEMLALMYACAEVFLFPSWDEGFGFPLIEAMASGVPVVASSRGSLPEIGQDGAIFMNPHEGPEPFIEAVQMLLSDPEKYQHYRDRGLLRQQFYRSARMIERTVQVYQEALGR